MSRPTGANTSVLELAGEYPEQLEAKLRKEQGAWFTPMALALPTAARALKPLLANGDPARLRIVDPAVGGGVFLVAALRTLLAAGVRPRAAAKCVFGIDCDATAAALAASAVHEACGDADIALRDIATRIRAGDGLRDLEPATFDAVLTNPPWETLQAGSHTKARVDALRPHFRHQGRGKLFTYRLFVERALQLLRPGGRFGLIVPASLWFDRDAEPLRRLLLDECEWEWLFGFENRERVFAIDSRYRFGVIVGTKGGRTDAVKVAFARTAVSDWARSDPRFSTYGRDELRAVSPTSGAFVEIEDRRDLDLLRRIQSTGAPLVGDGAALSWRQGDFNMTADRGHFVEREHAIACGHRPGGDGAWRNGRDAALLPLLQGAMIGDLHPNAAAHVRGTGHATTWRPPRAIDEVVPAYFVPAERWRATASSRPRARIVLRALSNATNERTAIACLVPDRPCGNSLGVLTPLAADEPPLRMLAATAAVLSSLAFDHALRLRLVGTNLNHFVLADCVRPRLDEAAAIRLAQAALRLCAILPDGDTLWRDAAAEGWRPDEGPATQRDVRRDLATQIDLLAGRAFGLDAADVAWIVRGCDAPTTERRRTDARAHGRGFWRTDRTLPPHERRPMRWLAAARE
ncbi:MAG: N-6 DNA methylase [Planctomycetes bacterium]|nr:N-6 DNA methylase [Planctomycetota bacterium]